MSLIVLLDWLDQLLFCIGKVKIFFFQLSFSELHSSLRNLQGLELPYVKALGTSIAHQVLFCLFPP